MTQPIVIVGCTASGKSDLAEALAARLAGVGGTAGMPATILAVDSMQVYRGMDIGTAKPSRETRARIPHAMIDVADPWEAYSAARFAAEARPILDEHGQGGRPIIVIGGTILYLRALLEGLFEGPSADAGIRAELEARAAEAGVRALHVELGRVDELAASRIHANDLRRIVRALEVYRITGTPISALQTQWAREHPAIEGQFIGVHWEKEALNRRINARVRQMVYPPALEGKPVAEILDAGLVGEVRRLLAAPRGLSKEAASGVGYRQLIDHFEGRCSLEDAMEEIKIATRRLAKLQRTWLKRFNNVTWLDAGSLPAAAMAEQAMQVITSRP